MKKIILYTLGGLFLMFLFLIVMGDLVIFQIVVSLLFGWFLFLGNNLFRMNINWGVLIPFFIFIAGFFGIMHLLAKNCLVQKERPVWKAQWSASILLILIFSFFSGLSVTGIVSNIEWIKKEPYFYNRNPRFFAKNAFQYHGYAMNNFLEINDSYPTYGFQPEDTKKISASWETKLLPFIEQSNTHSLIDFSHTWNHPKNNDIFKQNMPVFLQPLNDYPVKNEEGFGLSHYSANIYLFARTGKLTNADINDGLSNTIISGEVSRNFFPWGKPGNWRDPGIGLKQPKQGFRGPFPRGTYFLMADGTAKMISNDTDPKVLQALSTPNGGEKISKEF